MASCPTNKKLTTLGNDLLMNENWEHGLSGHLIWTELNWFEGCWGIFCWYANSWCYYFQVLDELKQLGGITIPVAAVNCVVYVRAMVSVLCLGRLGGLELAGGALSIGFTNITGYSILFGLASGMDPVCSQAFGSKNSELIGISLQRTILILLSACVPISLLWLNLESIMLWLGQDASITAVASTYCLYSLPDLLTNSMLQPLRV